MSGFISCVLRFKDFQVEVDTAVTSAPVCNWLALNLNCDFPCVALCTINSISRYRSCVGFKGSSVIILFNPCGRLVAVDDRHWELKCPLRLQQKQVASLAGQDRQGCDTHIVYTLEKFEEVVVSLMLGEGVVTFFWEVASLLHPVKNCLWLAL